MMWLKAENRGGQVTETKTTTTTSVPLSTGVVERVPTRTERVTVGAGAPRPPRLPRQCRAALLQACPCLSLALHISLHPPLLPALIASVPGAGQVTCAVGLAG